MIVVDASVAVKWFVPEEDSDAADGIINGSEKLLAPDIIRTEVLAGLTRKLRLGEAGKTEIRHHCVNWRRMLSGGIIALFPSEEDEAHAIDLALALKHPFQDCLYLALAQRLKAPLITADPKFLAKIGSRYKAVHLSGAVKRLH